MIDFRVEGSGTLAVTDEDLRRVFDVLLELGVPGALSAAALLIHEGRQPTHFRPVELNPDQGEALRKAVLRLVESRSRWLGEQFSGPEEGTAADSHG
jgi:hypothetical protein